jgi:hypothetical protein
MQCLCEVQQFHLFNVCLHIDATDDSNKEGSPLVTISSKDFYGKMFIVLGAFLPNEQSWSYKWFFSYGPTHTTWERRLEKNQNHCNQ